MAREKRFIAIEDASRYRDALGAPLPAGLADRYLQPVADPTGDLVLRYARTHGPFTPHDVARRYGLGVAVVTAALDRFVERGRLIEGEFRPGGTQREWCDGDVLRAIRRRSLAKLRKEVEPVETKAYVRLIGAWQLVTKKRRGLEGLLEVIEALQGAALPASIFESEILAARIDGYKPSDLDTLSAAGEIVWTGVEPLGERDGRIALYLTDHLPLLHAPVVTEPNELEQQIVEHLPRERSIVLCSDPDGARRLRERCRRRALEPRLARRHHERHVSRAARLRAPEGGAARDRIPLAPRRAAVDAGALVARAARAWHDNGAGQRARASTPGALRNRRSRGGRRSSRSRAASARSIRC